MAVASVGYPAGALALIAAALAMEGADPLLRGPETGVNTRRLRILLDGRMLLGRFSGVARVVTELADALARHPDLELFVLCGNEPYPPWTNRQDITCIRSNFGRSDRTAARRLWFEEIHLPRIIRDAGVDLWHATWNSGIPARCPVPSVLTIHDLIPWHDAHASFAGPWQRAGYRHAVRTSARRAALITTVSEHVRQDVLGTLHPDPARTVAIPNGVRQTPLPPTEGAEEGPSFALYVGGHEPRKNLSAVFAAMQRYWQRFDDPLEVRLTGSEAALDPIARKAYGSLAFKDRIRFLGTIEDEQLAVQYASASVLLLLSSAEGFGLPVLEAMAAGCPVIAADRAALPEVVGDAGVLVNPDDVDQVCNALRRILTEPDHRRERVTRGRQRAATMGWDAIAGRYWEIYERAVQASGTYATRTRNEKTEKHPVTSLAPSWVEPVRERAESPR